MSDPIKKIKEAEITYLDTVQPVEVRFLAYPYLPLGKIVLLSGDPGIGKSTISINMAAMLSIGKPMFGFDYEAIQGKTIYLSAEDNVADTLKPRLMSAGADCSQIAIVNNIGFDLSADCQILENALIKTKARLVIIDPLAAYIGKDADMCRAADMRRMMGGLAVLAEKYDCTILSISHLTKASGTKSLYRGLGSIDIAASARSVMLVERSGDDPDIRLLSHIKSSYAPEGAALGFSIGKGSVVTFHGEYENEVNDTEYEELEDGKREVVSNMLLRLLSQGAVSSLAIQQACTNAGLSERTLNRAKKDLGVRSVRKSDSWYWTMN